MIFLLKLLDNSDYQHYCYGPPKIACYHLPHSSTEGPSNQSTERHSKDGKLRRDEKCREIMWEKGGESEYPITRLQWL